MKKRLQEMDRVERKLYIVLDEMRKNGRNFFVQDTIVIEALTRLFFETEWMNEDTPIELFVEYIHRGVLDFDKAKLRSQLRSLQ